MHSNGFIKHAFAIVAAISLSTTGCEDNDNTAGTDYGDNDPNLVVCIGDSLTMGYMSEGEPYPTRLAGMTGKTIYNYGVGGVGSDHGVSVISSVVARKPAYVCILYGSNDAITLEGVNLVRTKENLRRIITMCRIYKCIPIIATIPPQNGPHLMFNGNATRIADAIRELAAEESVCLVDLNRAFGDGSLYLNPEDGLHLSDAGGDLIAKKFSAKIP